MDLPMTRRLMEYSAIIVRMPERRAGIFNLVWSRPVHSPPSRPAIRAKRVASQGFMPPLMNRAATAPPRAMVPSTVRSATSRTR